MPDLSNSLAQFIISASIGLLAVIAAVFIPIFIYRRQKNRKEITWQVISSSSVLPILDIGEQAKSKLQISYGGKSVDDLRLVVLKVSNTGNIPIESNDFENNSPITFDFGKEAEILNVEILDTTPASFKSRAEAAFKVSQGKVNLEPLLLNSEDAITFKVLLIKFMGRVNVSGRISGVKEIVGLETALIRSRRVRLIYLGLAVCLVSVGAILWILNALNVIQGGWISTIVPTVFTAMGVVFTLAQYLFPSPSLEAKSSTSK